MRRSLGLFRFGMNRKTQLHIFEGTSSATNSGITATIYGCTGFMGSFIGGVLGSIGSDLIFPHAHEYSSNIIIDYYSMTASKNLSYAQ